MPSRVSTIECFPDDVRCHVLSFLPTRDAAATSLLSKRWKPLWLSLRSFDFHDRYFPDFRKFSNFVISFLSSPNSVHVQSLRLSCGSDVTFRSFPDDLDLFFNSVELKGVPELDLRILFRTKLPSGFYSCKTLVTLKLGNVVLDYYSCVDFPLLKSLILNDFIFGSQAIMFNFLCGCPNLEYLDLDARSVKIDRDTPPQVEEGAKSLPKLVRARIGYCNYILFPVCSNAQFLHAQMNVNDCVYNPMFHNLINLDVTLAWGNCCNVMWNWFSQVLHSCHKLQNLTIYKNFKCVDEIGKEHWKDPQIDLECLSTQLRTFTLKNYIGLSCEAQFAKYIMQKSKVLQNMTIQSTLNIDLEHPMLETFSLCPRGSATCKLHFDLQPDM